MLLIVSEDHAKVDTKTIDKVVNCDIRDPETNPRMYEAIKKFMVHGPCGQVKQELYMSSRRRKMSICFPESILGRNHR